MEEKRKVLFVDDEVNVLSGLKRILRGLRKEMDLHFTESGEDALLLMAEHHYDVIVSDMRMPGMDGAALLTEVKNRSPHTIRIVLSGEADEETISRTIGIAHQYLAKPCESHTLINILRRARDLHMILTDGAVKNIVSSIDSLPPMPELYKDMQEALKDPEVSSDRIGEIIEQDISMTAKILQLVNSSFFGLMQKVHTPSRAVKLLGIDMIKVLVLGLKIFDGVEIDSDILSPQKMWTFSLATANCSKLIAREAGVDVDTVSNCFIAGLLHDIGKLVIATQMKESYRQIIELAEESEKPFLHCEKEILSTTHADIGAYLIGLWGFNSEILESIAYHERLQDYLSHGFSVPLAVHLGRVASCRAYGEDEIGYTSEPVWAYIDQLNLRSEAEAWLEICEEYLMELEEI